LYFSEIVHAQAGTNTTPLASAVSGKNEIKRMQAGIDKQLWDGLKNGELEVKAGIRAGRNGIPRTDVGAVRISNYVRWAIALVGGVLEPNGRKGDRDDKTTVS
jgi:hypothetical protein